MKINLIKEYIATKDKDNDFSFITFNEVSNKVWFELKEELEPVYDKYAVDHRIRKFGDPILWREDMLKVALKPEEGFVPSYDLFLYDRRRRKVCGGINLRPFITDRLRVSGGNIGYYILPSERGNKLGKLQLAKACVILHDMGIREIYVSCHANNLASKSIIETFADICVFEGHDAEGKYPEEISLMYKIITE